MNAEQLLEHAAHVVALGAAASTAILSLSSSMWRTLVADARDDGDAGTGGRLFDRFEDHEAGPRPAAPRFDH